MQTKPDHEAALVAGIISRWERRRESLNVRPTEKAAFMESEGDALRSQTAERELLEQVRPLIEYCAKNAVGGWSFRAQTVLTRIDQALAKEAGREEKT